MEVNESEIQEIISLITKLCNSNEDEVIIRSSFHKLFERKSIKLVEEENGGLLFEIPLSENTDNNVCFRICGL